MIPFSSGRCLDGLDVRTGIRLRHPDCADEFATCQARQPVVPLLFVSVGKNVMCYDALNAEAKMNTRPSEFFYDNCLMRESPTPAAVFLGHVREEQTHPTG